MEENVTPEPKSSIFTKKRIIIGAAALLVIVASTVAVSFFTQKTIKPPIPPTQTTPGVIRTSPQTPGTTPGQPSKPTVFPTQPQQPQPQQQPYPYAGGYAKPQSSSGKPIGVSFVSAAIKPLKYELSSRLWGWRVNDLVQPTDNVNNFQRGVLEVTRRTAEQLAKTISRTGSTAAFDEDLLNAMNCFMINSDQYWLPSAESMYKQGLNHLESFRDRLEKGRAMIYTRKDNILPLLADYEALLGSCQVNLIKTKEENGKSVSFFKVDDYFYYAKGVASSIATILEPIPDDFQEAMATSISNEVMNNAIASCKQAGAIEPWIILNSSYSSLMANHRANMAAPIGLARFFMGHLIKVITASPQ